MSERPGQVFEALLERWRFDEEQLISLNSPDMDADRVEADREMIGWRERYARAEAARREHG